MNHTKQTANAKINAKLFSTLSGNSQAGPLDLSQQESQTLLHIALATITHFFGPFDRFLAKIDDPRNQSRIKYPLHCLLFTGIWMFLCHLGARRQIALKLRNNAPSAANFKQLFGVDEAPHGDTLNYTFKNVSPLQVQESVTSMGEILIRKKVLERYRLLDHYYVIAMDGTGIYTFSERHCDHCLTKKHKDGTITYYHYVLETKLVTSDGLSLSLMSEFIENPEPDPTKQDCELKAFLRLAPRLKKHFPRLSICLSLDALFACGPVFELCHEYDWRFMIVLKDNLTTVNNEFVGLSKLQPENKLKEKIIKPAERTQDFRWVNGIEYCDSIDRQHQLNVVELKETKLQDSQTQTSRFLWVTDLEINKGNVREAAQNAGRDRWIIENQGFNSQKRGGFDLEHLYSVDYNSAKVFYFLLQIAHILFQLMTTGSLFKKYFPRGFGSLKNFAGRLAEAWRNSLLAGQVLDLLAQLRIQIRFDTS